MYLLNAGHSKPEFILHPVRHYLMQQRLLIFNRFFGDPEKYIITATPVFKDTNLSLEMPESGFQRGKLSLSVVDLNINFL